MHVLGEDVCVDFVYLRQGSANTLTPFAATALPKCEESPRHSDVDYDSDHDRCAVWFLLIYNSFAHSYCTQLMHAVVMCV